MRSQAFVITTAIGTCTKSQIWAGDIPLPVGHPFRWILEQTDNGIRIRDIRSDLGKIQEHTHLNELTHQMIQKGASIELPSSDGKNTITLRAHPYALGNVNWKSDPTKIPELSGSKTKITDPETEYFKLAIRYTAITLAAFTAMTWLWPKPDTTVTEVIPPQYAKIVLSQPQKPSQGGAAKGGAQATVTKAQDAAVVQAFRAKALQNAVSGLLKGGMTKLLAQSDFVSGHSTNAGSRRIFDTKSSALVPTGPATGLVDGRVVKVGGVGGAGGAGGSGVGYGKGEHAGVSGQGKSFVSMDIPGSNVQEGLTKDEVGAVIHRHLSEIRYCYESAMIHSPDIEGKLIVDFIIGGNGGVKSSSIKSSTLPDPRVDDCILRRLATWKFPNPKGGIDVGVTYPFIFKTLGR